MQNPMTTDVEPLPARSPAARHNATSPKVLWGTIGALAIVVAALGGLLLHERSNEVTAVAAMSNTMPAQPSPSTPATANVATDGPVPGPGGVPHYGPPAVAQAPAPAEARPAAAPVCRTCGRVESVTTVRHAAAPTGVGAVAGGVLGGVLGNQIGHGGGRTAATVIGAVGGGYLGNTVEQRTRTVTAYQVHVRMADGSVRTVETRTAPPVGKAVVVEGQVLRPADGRI
jgi:outer membrane lipoprotein SlyB